jgi:hypothetical protein
VSNITCRYGVHFPLLDTLADGFYNRHEDVPLQLFFCWPIPLYCHPQLHSPKPKYGIVETRILWSIEEVCGNKNPELHST